MMTATEKRLKALRKRRDAIEGNDLYSASEKDERLKEIESMMEAVVDKFNGTFNSKT